MKFIEKYFAVLAVLVTVLGLLFPALGWPFRIVAIPLMGILFFSGLKLDFSAALREFRRPLFLLYLCLVCLIVLPLGVWAVARWILPEFALGVLIMALMPAGMACGSLTDIARGNPALALVVVLATSLLCPITVPLMITLATGELAKGGFLLLAYRAGYLAGILFLPMTAAWLVRRHWPDAVRRHRDGLTGMSIVFLMIVILGAMSSASADCMRIIRQDPEQAIKLIAFLFAFSAVLHVAGYFLAPWRPLEDRAAISIDTAYVNNGLGVVFAQAFYGPLAMLPSVLLEIPMTLAILPVQWFVARKKRVSSPTSSEPVGTIQCQMTNVE